MPSRRTFLAAAAASLTAIALPPRPASAMGYQLTPRPAYWPVIGAPQPQTAVWAYNGLLPGPLLRVMQGDRLTTQVTNGLEGRPTTVHWHGIRLPNAMDGVPGLTQAPIRPGESFTYDFACRDAGTFWYHPHLGSPEQLGRGLYGALIVDEPKPPPVDRDVLWVLDDMRLDQEAQIAGDFRNAMDLSHAGRLGNTFLMNGSLAERFPLRAGERVRLRLLNAANARVFHLRFEEHRPYVIALDGHPLGQPAQLGEADALVLGPGMRADLVLDAAGTPDARYRVLDSDPRGSSYRLLDLHYGPAAPLRRDPLPAPRALKPNPVAEPDLAVAERLSLVLSGGAMGAAASLEVDGQAMSLREAFQQHRVAWGLNGQAMTDHDGHRHHTLFDLRLGRSYVVAIDNQTAWPHPIHLHGHAFRVLSRNGRPEPQAPFADTVLLQAREKAEIAFVADNPGEWMLHCHIQEHQAAGMMATVRVA